VIKPFLPRVNMAWENYRSSKRWGVIFGVLGIFCYYLSLRTSFPVAGQQIVYMLQKLSLLSITILFVLQLRGYLGLRGTIFLWMGLVPARLFLGMGTGATAQTLEIILFLLMIYATIKQRMPWKLLAVGIFTLIVLVPVRVEFRALTWGGEESERTPAEKSVLFMSLVWDLLSGEREPFSQAVQVSTSRLAHIMTLAEVVSITPASVPFWGGETYYPILFKPIPRFLFPGKPEEISGQTFGHRYAFLNPADDTTSDNLPQLVEFYINFGMIGVIVGMFLMGTIYRLLHLLFIHPGIGLGSIVAGIYILTNFLFIESALSMTIGGLFWNLVLFYFINLVITTIKPSSFGEMVSDEGHIVNS
jgi:hypothetical protein